MSTFLKTHVLLFSISAGVLPLGACSEQPIAQVSAEETAAPAEASDSRSVRRGELDTSAPLSDCNNCGTVRSIEEVSEEGDGTGVGAVLGAIVGGVAGNQVGGGSGKKIATVAGALGGAVAGDKIEENRNSEVYYKVHIAMKNGTDRLITVADASGISIGSEVRVEGNDISLR